jgi:NAD(P)-dependent dehydrogenase (short-subunit alcohol dehydrogenase family)
VSEPLVSPATSEFGGRSVVVTGAARGIGLAIAEVLHTRGARVLGIDLNPPEDASVFADFRKVDLSDGDSVDGWFSWIRESEFAPLYGLVSNAVLVKPGTFLQTPSADLNAGYAVNLLGFFRFAQAAASEMVHAGGGSIVNISTVNAERGVGGFAAYAAFKGAVSSLTRAMAVELADRGVRCNVVAPALTRTMAAQGMLTEQEAAARIARIPMGRFGRPQEVAEAVCFLLSDRSSFTTGVTLPVDGGYLAYGSR